MPIQATNVFTVPAHCMHPQRSGRTQRKPISLDEHYDQTRALLFNIYHDARELEEGEIKIGQPFGPQQGKVCSFIHNPPESFKSQACYSRLYLFQHGPWFIKYRLTNLPKEDGKTQKEFGQFMHLLHWPELSKN